MKEVFEKLKNLLNTKSVEATAKFLVVADEEDHQDFALLQEEEYIIGDELNTLYDFIKLYKKYERNLI